MFVFGALVTGCAFVSTVLAFPSLHPYQRAAAREPKRPVPLFVFVKPKPAPNKALDRYKKSAHASLPS